MNKKTQLLKAKLPDLARFKTVSLKLILSIAILLIYVMKIEEGFGLVVMNFNNNGKWSRLKFRRLFGDMNTCNVENAKGVTI